MAHVFLEFVQVLMLAYCTRLTGIVPAMRNPWFEVNALGRKSAHTAPYRCPRKRMLLGVWKHNPYWRLIKCPLLCVKC